MPAVAHFGADFSNFVKAVNDATTKVRGFEEDSRKVQTQLNRIGDSFSGKKIIQEALESAKAVRELGGLSTLTEAEIKKLSITTGEAAQKMKALGLEGAGDMAEFASQVKNATTDFDNFDNVFKNFVAGFVTGEAIVAAAHKAFDLFVGLIKDSITAFTQQEAATNKLNQALKTTGQFTPELSKQYQDLSTSFQKTTVYSDELIQEMEALLVQVGNVAPSQMQKALTAATDLASGLGIDLQQATLLVGKAFAGETGTLKRYGIVLDETALKADGVNAVLEGIQKRFGGQAQAETETYAGQLKQVANAFGEIEESIGGAILNIPVVRQAIRDLGNTGKDAAVSQETLTTAFDTFVDRLRFTPLSGLAAYIQKLNEAAREANAFADALDRAAKNPDLAKFFASQQPKPDRPGNQELIDKELAAGKAAGEEQKKQIEKAKEWQRTWAEALKDAQANWRTLADVVDLAFLKIKTFAPNSVLIPQNAQLGAPTGGALGIVSGRFNLPGNAGLNLGPADIREAAFQQNLAAQPTRLLSGLNTALPQSIIAALQGGGSVPQAVAGTAGAQIGNNLVSKFGESITKNLGKVFGGAINSILPGVGALAGPLIGKIGQLFGGTEESNKVSPIRNEFFKLQGGLEKLNPIVVAATGNLKQVQAVFDAKTVDEYEKAVGTLTKTLDGYNQKIATAAGDTLTLGTRFQQITDISPDLQAALATAFNATTVDEYARALGDVNRALDEQAGKQAHLEDLAKKYGIALKDLGPQFAQGEVDKQSKTLIEDWTALSALGGNNDAILKGMAKSFSELVQQAKSTGSEIPNSLKEPLKKLQEMGLLVDESGQAFKDLDGLKFGDTLQTHLDDLKTSLDQLKDTLEKLPGALAAIPKDIDFNVRTHIDTSGVPTGSDFGGAFGGVVTGTGIQHLAGGGRVLRFPGRPSGRDTVPIWAAPGELLLTPAQQRALLNGGGSGTTVIDLRGSVIASDRSVKDLARKMSQEQAQRTFLRRKA